MRPVFSTFLAAVFLALLCIAPAFAYAESEVPKVKIVKGPDKPLGKYAKTKGVIEFFEMTKLEDEKDDGLQKAKEAYTKYVKKYKDQPTAVLYLAAVTLKLGDEKGAKALIKKADNTNPG